MSKALNSNQHSVLVLAGPYSNFTLFFFQLGKKMFTAICFIAMLDARLSTSSLKPAYRNIALGKKKINYLFNLFHIKTKKHL